MNAFLKELLENSIEHAKAEIERKQKRAESKGVNAEDCKNVAKARANLETFKRALNSDDLNAEVVENLTYTDTPCTTRRILDKETGKLRTSVKQAKYLLGE